jgi:hypothetical protein
MVVAAITATVMIRRDAFDLAGAASKIAAVASDIVF